MQALILGFFILLAAAPAFSSNAPVLSLQEMTTQSHMIFSGKLVETKSRWESRRRFITTDCVFETERALLNRTRIQLREGERTAVTFWGGVVGEATHLIAGAPRLEIGQRYLLLLAIGSGSPTAAIVGLDQGLFLISNDQETGKESLLNARGLPLRLEADEKLGIVPPGEAGRLTLRQMIEALQARISKGVFVEMNLKRGFFIDEKGLVRELPSLRPDSSTSPSDSAWKAPHGQMQFHLDAHGLAGVPSPPSTPVSSLINGISSPSYSSYGYADLPIVINQFPETPDWFPWSPYDQYQMGKWNKYADVFRVRQNPTGTYGWNNGRWDLCGWLTDSELQDEYGVTWGGATATTLVKMSGSKIEEADIAFNAAFNYSVNPVDVFNGVAQSFPHLLLHELGHVWGANHSFTQLAVMNYGYLPWQSHHIIYADDTEGIRSVYPSVAVHNISDAGAYLHYCASSQYIEQAVFPSTAVKKGESFILKNIHVENAGTLNVTPEINFYLTPTRDFNTTYFLGSASPGTYSRGQFQLIDRTFTVPDYAPAGQYFIGLIIQGSDYWNENDSHFTWTRLVVAAVAPNVQTGNSASITETSVTLNGSANPRGESTWFRFEYGLTTSLGSSTSWQNIGSGTSDIAVSANISSLQPNTVFYYRVSAKNSGGSVNGDILSFKTLPLKILTVNASGGTGFSVSITVAPVDYNGQTNGTTPFIRNYRYNNTVYLTAPSSSGVWYFQKWQSGGIDISNNVVAVVNMDADYTVTAVYSQIACPLGAPVGDSPHGKVSNPLPTFTYSLVKGADAYVAVYLPVNNPGNLMIAGVSITNSLKPSSNISDGDYVWGVLPWSQQCGFGTMSTPLFFTIPGACPATPALLSPAAGNQVESPAILAWSSAAYASFYGLWIVDASTWQLVDQQFVVGEQYTAALQKGIYVWAVAGFNTACGFGTLASPSWFEVK